MLQLKQSVPLCDLPLTFEDNSFQLAALCHTIWGSAVVKGKAFSALLAP